MVSRYVEGKVIEALQACLVLTASGNTTIVMASSLDLHRISLNLPMGDCALMIIMTVYRHRQDGLPHTRFLEMWNSICMGRNAWDEAYRESATTSSLHRLTDCGKRAALPSIAHQQVDAL